MALKERSPVKNQTSFGTLGRTITPNGASAGLMPSFEVRRVMATGTTASVATVED